MGESVLYFWGFSGSAMVSTWSTPRSGFATVALGKRSRLYAFSTPEYFTEGKPTGIYLRHVDFISSTKSFFIMSAAWKALCTDTPSRISDLNVAGYSCTYVSAEGNK